MRDSRAPSAAGYQFPPTELPSELDAHGGNYARLFLQRLDHPLEL